MSVAYEPDPTARLETIEYRTAVGDYLETEVHPYVPDAWHDPDKTKIGYEIPLTRHFYTYTPPRLPGKEIDAEIKALEAEIRGTARLEWHRVSRFRLRLPIGSPFEERSVSVVYSSASRTAAST